MADLLVNNIYPAEIPDTSLPMAALPAQNADVSIFEGIHSASKRKAAAALEKELQAVKDNNGLITGIWNSTKELSGMGTSGEKCDNAVEAFKKGEITFEEASKKIKEYSKKQSGSLNLFSNIISSIAALGVTAAAAASIAASGGAASPLILGLIAGGTGAAAKAGFKLIDRASNNIDNDALDTAQIARDSLSGAVTGSIAAVTMGTASSASSVMDGIVKCAATGVKTGALSCGANYAIDSALDKDKEFNAQDFLWTTAEGALFGGAVGAVMGGINSSLHQAGLLKSGCGFTRFIETNGGTRSDFAANSVCTTGYKVMNDRFRHALS